MRTIELLAIGIRLLGMYFLVKCVQFIGTAYASYHQMAISLPEFNPLIILGAYAITAVLMFAFAIIFIKFPAIISKSLLPRTSVESPVLPGSPKELLLAGFAVLGVYILSWAIPDLIHNSALLIVIPRYEQSYSMGNRPYDLINLGVSVVEIVIGLYLTLQAQGLVRLINKVRYGEA